MSSVVTPLGKGLGIQADPSNLERPLITTPCGYRDYDPEMIKNHEDYCPACKELKERKP